jgi:DNA-binding PadR family transcriptional regulator
MRLATFPEPALLGFLLDGPMHGYELYKQMNQHLGPVWSLGRSQMYGILANFAARGWIKGHLRHQGARPTLKILELTPAGRKAFEAWLYQPAHGLREFRIDFFLRLYFVRRAGAPFARDLVEGQMAAARRELEALRSRQAEPATEEEDIPQLTRDFRFQQLTTIIKWLESHRAQLIQPKPITHIASARTKRRAQTKPRASHPRPARSGSAGSSGEPGRIAGARAPN